MQVITEQKGLFEISPDLLAVLDFEGYFIWFNSSWGKTLGFKTGDLTNRSIFDLVHKDDRSRTQEELLRLIRSTHPIRNLENRLCGADGNYRWLRWDATVIPSDLTVYCYLRDITGEKLAVEGQRRQSAILEAAAFTAEHLLRSSSWRNAIDEVLHRLGEAAAVSRVYLFGNHIDERGRLLTSQRFEWTAAHITSQIDNPDLQSLPYEEAGYSRWVKILGSGQPLASQVRDMPESERPYLEAQSIISVAAVPVFVNNSWWGFIGFDDCVHERIWTDAELDALRIAGGVLGAAIERQEKENALQHLNQTLEARVEERTCRLEEVNQNLLNEIEERLLIERVLRERTEQLETIFENAAVGILQASPDRHVLSVNQRWCDMLGYSREEVLGCNSLIFTHPEDQSASEAQIQRLVLSEADNVSLEKRLLSKSGETIWTNCTTSVVRETTGRIKYYIAVIEDVSQRKVAEVALKEGEIRFRQLADAMPQLVWTANADGITDYYNQRLKEFGDLRGDGDKGSWLTVIHPDDRERTVEAWRQASARGEVFEIENRGRLADGEYRWYLARAIPIRDETGRIVKWYGTATDIHYQKESAEKLEHSKRLLAAILDHMPSGVFVVEAPSGKLLFNNEEALCLLRVPKLPSRDQTMFGQCGALHALDQPYAPEEYPIARALLGETVHQQEVLYRRGDGTLATFFMSAAPVRGTHGEIVMAVCTFHDISIIKQAQEELRKLNETLEERVEERTVQVRALSTALTRAEQRERRRISYVLHEDVQQLLFGLDMQAKVLSLDPPSNKQALQARLEDLRVLLKRSINTIRNLSIELNPPILRGEGLDAAIKWLIRHMEETYRLKVDLRMPRAIKMRDHDQHILIVQLVRELLFNVFKHAGVDRAFLDVQRNGKVLSILVEDHGKGFDVKRTLLPSTYENHMGLMSIQERLRLFGGTLEIDSATGAGTRAKLVLPCLEQNTSYVKTGQDYRLT